MLTVIVGLITGFLNGSLGIGGGFIIVPYYMYILGMQGHLPFGTSVAAFPITALVASLAHKRLGNIKFFPGFWLFMITAILGGLVGGFMGRFISDSVPKVVFGIVAMFAAYRMFQNSRSNGNLTKHSNIWLSAFFGILAGLISGLTGLGGGIIFVPVLHMFFGLSMTEAVAFSAITMIGTTAFGTIGHAFNHSVDWKTAGTLLIGAVVGAPIGAKAATVLPDKLLKRIFAIVVFILGLKVLIDVWR